MHVQGRENGTLVFQFTLQLDKLDRSHDVRFGVTTSWTTTTGSWFMDHGSARGSGRRGSASRWSGSRSSASRGSRSRSSTSRGSGSRSSASRGSGSRYPGRKEPHCLHRSWGNSFVIAFSVLEEEEVYSQLQVLGWRDV